MNFAKPELKITVYPSGSFSKNAPNIRLLVGFSSCCATVVASYIDRRSGANDEDVIAKRQNDTLSIHAASE